MDIQQAVNELEQWLAAHPGYAAFIDSPILPEKTVWQCELLHDDETSHIGHGQTMAEAINCALEAAEIAIKQPEAGREVK